MGHDTIRLTGLSLSGRHGVLESEKQDAQPFVVDVEMHLDLQEAGRSDSLADTVSYAEAAEIIEPIVTVQSHDLIESLAETIARSLLTHYRRIHSLAVTVHKPQAPMAQTFDDVAVTVRRSRSDVSASPGLAGPRPEVTDYYEAELVDDQAGAPTSGPSPAEGATITTPTAHLGYYDRISLAELGHDDSPGPHLRDPEQAAAFPVRCVLALGSNLGDSQATVASAVHTLQACEEVEVINVSPLARTKPVGGPQHQRDYLNQVVEIETRLAPHDLLDLAQRIEADHNRVRQERWGPRTLDVDIVTYASATIDSPRLQVPHPSAADRAFVLLPWSWMDPMALLNGHSVRELATQATDFDEVARLNPDDVEE